MEETGNANNPFRYASYIYDEESKLYYLNARYYDPLTGRFTTEDTVLGENTDPLSLNLYAYAHGNPLRYVDPTGHSVLAVVATIAAGAFIGALIAGGANYIRQGIQKGWDNVYMPEMWVSAAGGFVSGALMATGIPVGYAMVGNAVISTATYMGTQYVNNEASTLAGATTSAVIGAASAWLGGSNKELLNNLTKIEGARQLSQYLGSQSGVQFNEMLLAQEIQKAAITNALSSATEEAIVPMIEGTVETFFDKILLAEKNYKRLELAYAWSDGSWYDFTLYYTNGYGHEMYESYSTKDPWNDSYLRSLGFSF